MPEEASLTGKVVKSSAWMLSFQVIDNLLGVLRLFIIARILSPADFGLVGVAVLTKQILDTFTQTGLGAVLIYRKDAEQFMNAAWTFLLVRGMVLAAVVYLAAPYFGAFFGSPDSVALIRVVGLTFLIDALANIGPVMFQKQLQFRKVFVTQLVGNVLDAVAAIAAAFVLKNAWAVVLGLLANSTARVVMSYTLSSYRPRIDVNLKKLREMYGYGKWVFWSTILQFLYGQADDILVGRVLGTTSLGFYQLAYRISNLPTTQITNVINNVMFPAYSKVQSDQQKMTDAYLRTLQLTASLTILLGAMIISFANEFITLFLGEQWLPMQTALQLLTIWGVMRSLGATTGAFWKAQGTPEIVTKIQLIQTIIMAILIYPATIWWGYAGTALAVVAAAAVGNAIAFVKLCRWTHSGYLKVLKEFAIPLMAAVAAGGFVLAVKQSLLYGTTYAGFTIAVILFIGMYAAALVFLSRILRYSLFSNLSVLIEHTPLPLRFKKYFALLKRFS